jgi:hypothetical protein
MTHSLNHPTDQNLDVECKLRVCFGRRHLDDHCREMRPKSQDRSVAANGETLVFGLPQMTKQKTRLAKSA